MSRHICSTVPALNKQSPHHFIVGHELQDAGCNPTPELQASEDGVGGKFCLVLVLQGRSSGRLLAVDGPQLGKHEGVEKRAHVQHRRLGTKIETKTEKASEEVVDQYELNLG